MQRTLSYTLVLVTALVGCGPDRPAVNPTLDAQDPISGLEISTTELPPGVAGADYGPVTLAVEGGAAPFEWRVTGGRLPRPDLLDAETGTLGGLVSTAGEFVFEVEVVDATGAAARRELVLPVQTPADLDARDVGAVGPGEHYVGRLTVRAGDTLVVSGGPTTLNVTGRLLVEPGARIEVPDCGELVINALSETEPAEIYGDVVNTCADPAVAGGDLVIRTVGGLRLGGDEGAVQTRLESSGMLFVGDPWYRPRQEPTALQVVGTGEPEQVGPVCAIQADAAPAAGLPAVVAFTAQHADPDGGATRLVRIDYGDGVAEEAPTALEHVYDRQGLFEVTLVVADDEDAECEATLTLSLADEPDEGVPAAVAETLRPASVWAAAATNDAEGLIRPVGVPFTLAGTVEGGSDSVAIWESGDGRWACAADEGGCAAQVSLESPGLQQLVLVSETANGTATMARMTVYAPLQGGRRAYSDPPAPSHPIPPLPERPATAAQKPGLIQSALTDGCTDCALCESPESSGEPVVVLGNAMLTSWWHGPLIVIGYESATVIINPSLTFVSTDGADGVAPGEDGKVAKGFGAASLYGKIVLCGGTFVGAQGGDGAADNAPVCDGESRGGRGAAWFGVLLTTPYGELSYCGDLFVFGGQGGDGAAATNNTTLLPAVPACTDGCGARATGGRGGYGGGGIAYTAGSVCYDTDYTVFFDADGGTRTGGDGGGATAAGSTPPACNQCDTYAGSGGRARTWAGNGGNSAWYFITDADSAPEPEDIQVVVGGVYNGGGGGDSIATGGNGAASNCVGCQELAWAGWGGNARALGGYGVWGLTNSGLRGLADAWSGSGGIATATPNPAVSGPGCPGSAGCDLAAFGGWSGFATASKRRGLINPLIPPPTDRVVTSGVGGNASATGGTGGPGVGCPACAGGRGGRALAVGGLDVQGKPIRIDGNAAAWGGRGGPGSTCCTPPMKGGMGGAGGKARAKVGPTGVKIGSGGNGFNGGDGIGFGGPGNAGVGVGVPNGAPGAPGALCPAVVVPVCMVHVCDPATGVCVLVPAKDGTPCPDGDLCNGDEVCEAGMCVPGPKLSCDDGNPCTKDACDPATGCWHAPDNGAPCPDGDVCDGDEYCLNNKCVLGAPLNCDDGNPCTKDGCDPVAGCWHAPDNGAPCPDGDVCNGDEYCLDNTCVLGAPLNCDDDNPCTKDACDPVTGCWHAPDDGAPCPDGDVCNGDELCSGGQCVLGPPLSCDDDNPCTQGGCDPASGCWHEPLDGISCGDGDVCNGEELCQGGECAPGQAPSCDDDNPCTQDGCDPASGCWHEPLDGISCGDGDVCNGEELCQGGECAPGQPLDCDDGSPCTQDGCDPVSGCWGEPLEEGCGLDFLFVSSRDADPEQPSFDIYRFSGGGTQRLTDTPDSELHPVQCPASDTVYFTRLGGGNIGVFALAPEYGDSWPVTQPGPGVVGHMQPAPSADGSVLFVTGLMEDGSAVIQAIDPNTGAVDIIVDQGPTARALAPRPAVTPAGPGLFFSSDLSGEFQIYRLDLGGGSPVELTTGLPSSMPTPVAGGSQVVFVRGDVNDPWNNELWLMDFDGSDPIPLEAPPGLKSPALSVGDTVILSRTAPQADLTGAGAATVDIEIIALSLTSGDPIVVIDSPGQDMFGPLEVQLEVPTTGGSCTEPTDVPGCSGGACEDCVGALDPFCIEQAWDALCVEGAQTQCAQACGLSAAASCCTPGSCADEWCQSIVASKMPECAEQWHEGCAAFAATHCPICEAKSPFGAPGN